MKKKITLFAILTVLLLSLVSCGTDYAAQEEVYGIETASIESDMESMAQSLFMIDDTTLPLYIENYETSIRSAEGNTKTQYQMILSMLEGWDDANDEAGTLEGFGEFTIEKAGKTVTATLPLICSGRNVNLIYVYNVVGDYMEQTAINVNLVYTRGESIQRAGLNVLMGMGTVFVVLILISLVIYAFNIIPYLQKKFEKKNDTPAETSAAPVAAPVVEQATDDTELVAVIAAAIAASTGQSTDDFVVRSIKRRY